MHLDVSTCLRCDHQPKPDNSTELTKQSILLYRVLRVHIVILIILEWTTSLDTSSRTLFVREDMCRDVHDTSNVELRNNVRLLLNVELRNYVISRQIVERRVASDCYLNIVVSLDC